MTMEKRLVVLELLGLAAVAASLVFVGLEIQQNREIARATVRLELAQASQELLFAMADHPEVALIALHGKPPASPAETERARMLLRATIRGFENYAYQYRQGLFDEGEWEGMKGGIRATMNPPFVRAFWREVGDQFSPEFRVLMAELVPPE